jgi:hypothetical protein
MQLELNSNSIEENNNKSMQKLYWKKSCDFSVEKKNFQMK